MSVLTLQVDEVMRTLSNDGQYPFVVNDKTVDIVRFALNTGFTDVVLDEQTALRVMYQRPGESQVRAQTLTYHDTNGLHNYYDWQLLPSDLAEKGTLTVALCILRTDSEVEEWHTTPCQVRVLDTIHTDDSDEGDETITPTVAQRVAVLESMIQRVASGAPIVVASVSAMTDMEQIYVLSTNGNWYYHNGSAWVAGGEYGAVATDTTLTQSGMPADAKAAGDAIKSVNEKLNGTASNILSPMPTATPVWMSGGVSMAGAANSTDAKRIRNSGGSSMPRATKGDVIFVAYPYQARIIAYNANQLSTPNFYEAIQSDFVSGVIPIPDKYIEKYLGIAIKDSTQEDADISAAIDTINNYVKIYRPSQYFDSVNDSISGINTTLGNVDQWIMPVDTESEDESGKTDMAPAIMAMLTETGYCHLGEGIFYVSGIDMPEGSTLCGCGYKTEIRLLSSVTNGYAIKMTAYNTVSDLRVTGSYATPTLSTQGARSGIAFIANFDGNEGATTYKTEHCMVHNVWVSKFQNSGILCHNTSQTYRQGLHAINVFVSLCWCGINIDYNSEFNKFVNVLTAMCIRGCMNNGGNNVFTSCTFYGTKIAFYVDGTQPNSAHGTINGCTFCHAGSSKGSAITMTDVTAGFVISDCQIHYNSIDLTDCYGISFIGCEFGRGINSGKGATINIDGGGLVLFSGCMFMGDDDYPPEIAITDNTKVRFNGCYGSETGNAITA